MVLVCDAEGTLSQRKVVTETTMTQSFAETFTLSSSLNLIENGILTNSSVSRPPHLPGESNDWDQIRRERVRQLKGKYSHVLTSSTLFSLHKQEEIRQEG